LNKYVWPDGLLFSTNDYVSPWWRHQDDEAVWEPAEHSFRHGRQSPLARSPESKSSPLRLSWTGSPETASSPFHVCNGPRLKQQDLQVICSFRETFQVIASTPSHISVKHKLKSHNYQSPFDTHILKASCTSCITRNTDRLGRLIRCDRDQGN
jgi:hypothetical protein